MSSSYLAAIRSFTPVFWTWKHRKLLVAGNRLASVVDVASTTGRHDERHRLNEAKQLLVKLIDPLIEGASALVGHIEI